MDKKEQLDSILTATGEMQKHFNRLHQGIQNELQAIRQELLEIDIRLEELTKTRNLYSMNSSRRNVFSPIRPGGDPGQEKENELEENIRALTERKDQLTEQQQDAESRLAEIGNTLKMLHTAHRSATRLSRDPAFHEPQEPEEEPDLPEQEDPANERIPHGEHILNLEAFDRAYYYAILKDQVLSPLDNQLSRLENLKRLVVTDPQQAKLLLEQMITREKNISDVLRSHLSNLHTDYDEELPIRRTLNRIVDNFRANNPGIEFDASLETTDPDMVLPYTQGLLLCQLTEQLLDNIIRHSGASQACLRADIRDDQILVILLDNGIGIDNEYRSYTPWYSGLNRAEEKLYLLGGELFISGEEDRGTTVQFTIPIPE